MRGVGEKFKDSQYTIPYRGTRIPYRNPIHHTPGTVFVIREPLVSLRSKPLGHALSRGFILHTCPRKSSATRVDLGARTPGVFPFSSSLSQLYAATRASLSALGSCMATPSKTSVGLVRALWGRKGPSLPVEEAARELTYLSSSTIFLAFGESSSSACSSRFSASSPGAGRIATAAHAAGLATGIVLERARAPMLSMPPFLLPRSLTALKLPLSAWLAARPSALISAVTGRAEPAASRAARACCGLLMTSSADLTAASTDPSEASSGGAARTLLARALLLRRRIDGRRGLRP